MVVHRPTALLTVAVCVLAALPLLSCALVMPSRMFQSPISNQDQNVQLVFDVDYAEGDSEPCCRIHLPRNTTQSTTTTTTTTTTAAAHEFSFTARRAKHGDLIPKQKLVMDYEETVERMHLIKRAKKTLLPEILDVIFHDDCMVVVNKPAGVLCVPDINKHPSLLDLVWAKFGTTQNGRNPNTNENNNPSSMIVNRLDMDTSGIVIFGRNPNATRELNEAFRDRKVFKEYEALVCGHVQFDSGLIDLPLQRDHERPPFMRVSTQQSEHAAALLIDELKQSGYKKQGRKKPKSCQTKFQVVERFHHESDPQIPITRLRLQPLTGRTHQLRVHCAAIGHPIVGDPTYSLHGEAAMYGGLENAELTLIPRDASSLNLQRASREILETLASVHPPNVHPMCLHAALLRMNHPLTGASQEWVSPVPF